MNEFLNNTVWFGSSKASPIKIKILKATSKRAFDLIRSPSFRSAPQAPKNLRNHITEKIIQIPIDKPLSEYKVKEVENFSRRDQLSLYYCTWKLDIKHYLLKYPNIDIRNNDWFQWLPHNYESQRWY